MVYKKKIETPKDMYLDKQERIEKYVGDKDLNIRISWAVNCAVETLKRAELLNQKDEKDSLENWTDYFLDLFARKRNAYVNKRARQLEKSEGAADARDLDDADYSSEEAK